MARTQAADYDQRLADILEHAARLFAAKGFLGASVSDIAASCGSSKSLLYHYYKSKEDVLFGVMGDHLDALTEAMDDLRARALPPVEALRALSRSLMDLYDGAADSQKVLLYELDNLSEGRRRQIVGGERALVAYVDGLLGGISPALAADAPRCRALTMLYFGMLNWTHTWMDPKGGLSRDQVADMATDMVMRYLDAV